MTKNNISIAAGSHAGKQRQMPATIAKTTSAKDEPNAVVHHDTRAQALTQHGFPGTENCLPEDCACDDPGRTVRHFHRHPLANRTPPLGPP